MARKPKPQIRLVELDMSKADEHEHPDISTSKNYLCLIGGRYFAGSFNRQWYGLNFDNWLMNSLQFDEPGTNCSRWERIWEIREVRR